MMTKTEAALRDGDWDEVANLADDISGAASEISAGAKTDDD